MTTVARTNSGTAFVGSKGAPLRILGIVSVYCHPAWRGGGVARAATDILMELARRGNQVTVISPTLDGDKRFEPAAERTFFDGRLKLHFSTKAKGTRFGTSAAGLDEIMLPLVKDADVVDIHSFLSPWTERAADIARKHDVPFTIHDQGKLTPAILANRAFVKQVYLAVKGRRSLHAAARVFPCADTLTEAIRRWDPKIRCETCTNALPAEEFEGPAPARPIAEPYILFFAWLDPRKNPDLLIRAFAKIADQAPGWKLAMVGPDSYGEAAKLGQLAGQLGVGDRVIFPGMVQGEKKMAWLRNAEMFVLPSTGEGLSLAMLEAVACGLPSLLSPGCNYPEVEPAGAGKVLELNDDAWAEGMLGYITDADGRRRASENARKLFLECHTLTVVGASLEEKLRRAIAEYRAR